MEPMCRSVARPPGSVGVRAGNDEICAMSCWQISMARSARIYISPIGLLRLPAQISLIKSIVFCLRRKQRTNLCGAAQVTLAMPISRHNHFRQHHLVGVSIRCWQLQTKTAFIKHERNTIQKEAKPWGSVTIKHQTPYSSLTGMTRSALLRLSTNSRWTVSMSCPDM